MDKRERTTQIKDWSDKKLVAITKYLHTFRKLFFLLSFSSASTTIEPVVSQISDVTAEQDKHHETDSQRIRHLETRWDRWRFCRCSAAGSSSWPPPAPSRFCHVVSSDSPHEPPWAPLPDSLEPPIKDRKSKISHWVYVINKTTALFYSKEH